MHTYRNVLWIGLILLIHAVPTMALAQGKPDAEHQKAQLVSRIYQATYGAQERCSASPEGAASLGKSVELFRSKFPELIRLVDSSPYFGAARDNFQKFLDNPKAKVSDANLLLECQSVEHILRSMLDAPRGDEAVAEYIQLLNK